MKRSDYEAKSRRFWMDSVTPPMEAAWIPGWLEKYVANDVRAAEAAGVVWDPEEEPLPEELIYSGGLLLPLWRPLSDKGNSWLDGAEKEHVLREAVRRYNAWPELLRLLDDMERGDWTAGKPIARLHAILRGS